ncbi:MAG: flagellin [Sporomusaceae bacterium]|jgi:flagellin|nr:flagellin [Sporomusaceae bacterium]
MMINHNIPALNTLQQYQSNNRFVDKSIAKLASGLSINKAADNAAGLAIREKMRAQIRGIDQGYQNCADAISLIQTAEGGMSSIQNALHRMRELCVQAANDTVTVGDRELIQTEINELCHNIDQIANNTEFNTIKLLCSGAGTSGGTGGMTSGVHFTPPWHLANPSDTWEEYIFSADLTTNTVTSYALWLPTADPSGVASSAFPETAPLNNIAAVLLSGLSGYQETQVWASVLVSYGGIPDSNADYSPDKSLGGYSDGYFPTFQAGQSSYMTWQFKAHKEISPGVFVEEVVDLSKATGVTFYERTNSITPIPLFTIAALSANSSQNLIIHTGPNTDQELTLPLPVDMRCGALGLVVGQPSALTVNDANNSLSLIDQALAKVSSERAKTGAMQNRLEQILDNSASYSVNLSSAESRLSDVNMAKEMLNYTKQKILLSSSQAMLAQTNNFSQNILGLLG